MPTAVESIDREEDEYEEDDFEDDFESDHSQSEATSKTDSSDEDSHGGAEADEHPIEAPAAAGRPHSAHSSESSSSSSSAGLEAASSSSAKDAHRNNHISNGNVADSKRSSASLSSSQNAAAAARKRYSDSVSNLSTNIRSAQVAATSPAVAAAAARHTEEDSNESENEESDGRIAAHDATLPADQIVGYAAHRRADGSVSPSRSRTELAKSKSSKDAKQRGVKSRSQSCHKHHHHHRRTGHGESRHNFHMSSSSRSPRSAVGSESPAVAAVQRPAVPQGAGELQAMQRDNARLRNALFEKSRERYHANLAQSVKPNHKQPSCATTLAATGGGATTASMNTRDLAARMVQESLMAHRALQTLRIEHRELTQRREELKKQVRRYKRASQYHGLVEAAKQDILDYTEEHRDVQLEVRCNEKLLVLNDCMTESGVGDRRIHEEIRAQAVLTERRREHALRDADAAQRKRDAAVERVEKLQAELNRRRQTSASSQGNEVAQLRAESHAKAYRLHDLQTQVETLQERQRLARQHASHQQTRSKRDDAEREYLQSRVQELRRQLDAGQASNSSAPISSEKVERPASAQWPTNGSSASVHSSMLPPPRPPRTHTPLDESHSFRNSGVNIRDGAPRDGSAASSHVASADAPISAAASATHVTEAATAASVTSLHHSGTGANVHAAPAAAPEEFDVTAWLSAHPVVSNEPAAFTKTVQYGAEPSHHAEHSSVHGASSASHPSIAHPADAATATSASANADNTPAWLGDGGDDAAHTTAVASASHAAPSVGSSFHAEDAHPSPQPPDGEEELEEEVYEEEEEGVYEEDSYDEELGGSQNMHATEAAAAATAPPEAKKDDDGPDWLNF